MVARIAAALDAPQSVQARLPTAEPSVASHVPTWATDLAGGEPIWERARRDLVLSEVVGDEFSLMSARTPWPPAWPDEALVGAVIDAYAAVLMRLEKRGVHPVRIWNFVPQINREALSRQPRYHLFNRGRFSAFQSRCDGEPLSLDLCAASAVDIGTNELEVHVLASAHPGIAIENPRQVAAYEYSPRYGANPPCFTRATRLAPLAHRDWEGEIALVSGTASIVGEDSEHLGDVEAQARETLTNLAVVAATAFPGAARASSRLLSGDLARRDLLALYRLVRVYVVRETEIGDVVRLFEELLAADCELELVVADLCRPSLLLEAEGVAVWKQVAMESNRR